MSETPPSRRRPRYRGTHPRRFEERYKELDAGAHPEIAEHVRAQGRTPAGTHVPVLVEEVLAALDPRAGERAVDCTLGYGGHAERLLARLLPGGTLIAIDHDGRELGRARDRLAARGFTISPHEGNFAGIGKVLRAEALDSCDIILADLGVSSMQLDDPARGFSYKHDGPLDLRMDRRRPMTAAQLLQSHSREELATAFARLADEPDAERLARRIVEVRRTRDLNTTGRLVDLIFQVKGISKRAWRHASEIDPGAPHPAARVFQALRMWVNDELGSLRELLRQAPYCLSPGGRIGIISFHSGEDRLVEQSFHAGRDSGLYAVVSDGAVRPGGAERRENPRSASAMLRWARRSNTPL